MDWFLYSCTLNCHFTIWVKIERFRTGDFEQAMHKQLGCTFIKTRMQTGTIENCLIFLVKCEVKFRTELMYGSGQKRMVIYVHLPKRQHKSQKLDFQCWFPMELFRVWNHFEWFLKLFNLRYSDLGSIFWDPNSEKSRNSTYAWFRLIIKQNDQDSDFFNKHDRPNYFNMK